MARQFKAGYTIVESTTFDGIRKGRVTVVDVAGVRYRIVVQAWKRVKIAFKPRGHNHGWQYVLDVFDVTNSRRTFSVTNVDWSIGVARCLDLAGIRTEVRNDATV